MTSSRAASCAASLSPLGIDLPKWEGRVIETKKGVVRLFSVTERARILFGRAGADAVAQRLEKAPPEDIHQLTLFPVNEEQANGKGRGRGRRKAGADFLRLANALAALYPKGSEEKRLLDAMLLAVAR
jgi:hypothetical protein